ncbi:MAG: hypothetical protein WKF77_09550 [Planctomycetaceae bacterium]
MKRFLSQPAAEPAPVEPAPLEPTPLEPAPTAPTQAEPAPSKIESDGSSADDQPEEQTGSAEIDVKTPSGAGGPDLNVEPAEPHPAEILAVPNGPAALAAAGLLAVVPPTISAESSAAPVAGSDKIRVFGPSPAPETHTSAKSNPPGDKILVQKQQAVSAESLGSSSLSEVIVVPVPQIAKPAMDSQVPSILVPPVPLPSELLITLPQDQALRSVSNSGVLPNDKDHPPTEQPKEKKPERWKATSPERRKVIVVEEKTPAT